MSVPPVAGDRDQPILYLVTDRRILAPGQTAERQLEVLGEFLEHAIEAGVDLIQIREKDLDSLIMCEFTSRIVARRRERGTRILVNERADVALAARADGVHLTSTSIPPARVREMVGSQMLIGVSTHDTGEMAAAKLLADFAVLGPVFKTASKLPPGSPLGLERFSKISKEADIPVLAIGGINRSNAEGVLHNGAAGVAAINMFAKCADLAALVRELHTLPVSRERT